MKFPRWLIAGLIFLGLGLGALTFWLSTPQVVAVFPEDGATGVAAFSPLRLTFSRPMRTETVEQRLTMSPAQQGESRVESLLYTWEGNTLVFTPQEPWPAGESIRLSLAPGAHSARGAPMLREFTWTFTVSPPLLVYLWPADAPASLYALEPISGEVQRLIESPTGILDFSVGAKGLRLFFSQSNGLGGSDLYSWDRLSGEVQLLLACGAQLCTSPRPSLDGAWLAYTRTTQEIGQLQPGKGIWLQPLPAGEPRQVEQGGHRLSLPAWAPDGRLSYYDATEQAFVILDIETQQRISLPNQTGEAGTWSPEGNVFVVPELTLIPKGSASNPIGETVLSSHLMRFHLASGVVTDLTQGSLLEDAAPAFSPDGRLLAFSRKFLDPGRWTPGRQLWIMRSDGTQTHPLTNSPDHNHSALAWSPDGRLLAYVRTNQVDLTAQIEIWLYDLEKESAIRLMIGGYAPQWMP